MDEVGRGGGFILAPAISSSPIRRPKMCSPSTAPWPAGAAGPCNHRLPGPHPDVASDCRHRQQAKAVHAGPNDNRQSKSGPLTPALIYTSRSTKPASHRGGRRALATRRNVPEPRGALGCR